MVTTTAGGIPEVTGWGDPQVEPTAWSVPPRDPQSLAAAIREALDRPDRAALLAERARCRALRLFTSAAMVEATLAAFREFLGYGPD